MRERREANNDRNCCVRLSLFCGWRCRRRRGKLMRAVEREQRRIAGGGSQTDRSSCGNRSGEVRRRRMSRVKPTEAGVGIGAAKCDGGRGAGTDNVSPPPEAAAAAAATAATGGDMLGSEEDGVA